MSERGFEHIRTPRISREHVDRVLKEREVYGARYSMDSFNDVYSPEKIAEDKERLERTRQDFENNISHLADADIKRIHEGKQRSEALEVVIAQSDQNGWLGPEAQVVLTTPFDDVVHGIDAVVEFDRSEGARRVALALDASMRTDTAMVHKKVSRNIRKIFEPGGYSRVEYFESQIDNFKGRLEGVVPVVVGVDGDHCDAFLRIFADMLDLRSIKPAERTPGETDRFRQHMQTIEEHPMQEVLLEEIRLQLELYLRLMDTKVEAGGNVTREEIASILTIIREVINSKVLRHADYISEDGVLAAIADAVNIQNQKI